MKKLLAVTIGLTLCCGTASAQDWLEALKKTATTAVDNVTGGKLTEMALYGTWTYARPSVRFEGTDLSGNLSGSLLEALLVDQLSKIYLKAGIEAGKGTVTFEKQNAAFTASAGEHSVGGTYTFDSETHAITFRFTRGETELGSITSRAYLSGNELTIVFPVTRLVEMARELGNNIESLSTAAALLAQYENAYIGFAFSK